MSFKQPKNFKIHKLLKQVTRAYEENKKMKRQLYDNSMTIIERQTHIITTQENIISLLLLHIPILKEMVEQEEQHEEICSVYK